MSIPESYRSLAQLISRAQGADRISFLRLACEMADRDSCAALLWLHEPEPEGPTLVLDRYYNHADDGAPPPLLVGRRAPVAARAPAAASPHDPGQWGISLDCQPEIRQWCAEKGFPKKLHEYALPLTPDPESSADLVGVLHLVSALAFHDSVTALLDYLGDGLAYKILREREKQRLDALMKMLAGINLRQPVKEQLQVAADMLREALGAGACLVYQQARDLGLRAVAGSVAGSTGSLGLEEYVASPASVTSQILQKSQPVRLCNFHDEKERRRRLGTSEYDADLLRRESKLLGGGPLRALMGAPVVITGEGVAVVMLLNKKRLPRNWHLREEFSTTNQETLQAICHFLASVIPSIEIYHAMERISRIVFSGALQEANTRAAVFDVLAETIPGVACAVLSRRGMASGPRLQHLGGEAWFDENSLPHQRTGNVVPVVGSPAGEERYQYADATPPLGRGSALLVLGLRRRSLRPYEKQVIHLLCNEFGQALRSEQNVEEALEDLMQIRHVVRADLTGMVGHMREAIGCYDIYRQHESLPSAVFQARFRKALQRANLFAKRAQVVIEESRFLLKSITRDSLRIGSHSIGALLRGVVQCLRPAAEHRLLEINLVNTVQPDLDGVEVDWELVEMLVFNLLDNAVKYSHRGQDVFVEVSIQRSDWKLSVTNFGVYIQPEDREEIFKQFIRRPTGDSGSTRPGTGLGLAVVKKVVDAHGGTIEVSSELVREPPQEQAETCFVVRMPRKISRGNEP
jgi:signal transduction histidine kinase